MQCDEVTPIYQAYVREVERGDAFLATIDPGKPQQLGLAPPSPCGICMAACSIDYDLACVLQDDCVERHCVCDDCVADIPAGDVCRCAA